MNERFSWMKDVAGDKYLQNKPVEDLVQENKVLKSTTEKAVALGLNANTVRPFIQAQMNAAKFIQSSFIEQWKAAGGLPTGWTPRPLETVRAAIAKQSDTILADLANLLRTGKKITNTDQAIFRNNLKERPLDELNIKSMFSTLQQVRLNGASAPSGPKVRARI